MNAIMVNNKEYLSDLKMGEYFIINDDCNYKKGLLLMKVFSSEDELRYVVIGKYDNNNSSDIGDTFRCDIEQDFLIQQVAVINKIEFRLL